MVDPSGLEKVPTIEEVGAELARWETTIRKLEAAGVPSSAYPAAVKRRDELDFLLKRLQTQEKLYREKKEAITAYAEGEANVKRYDRLIKQAEDRIVELSNAQSSKYGRRRTLGPSSYEKKISSLRDEIADYKRDKAAAQQHRDKEVAYLRGWLERVSKNDTLITT